MKTLCTLFLFFILLPLLTNGQPAVTGDKKPKGYLTLSPSVSKPVGEFGDNINKKMLWGFNLEVVSRPFKKINFWDAGGQLEFLFPGNRKDKWDGIELKTKNLLARINLVNRIRPFRNHRIEPFFDLTYGLNLSSTETSYEVVDKATFMEKFFSIQDEDEIQTVSVKSFSDASGVLGLGTGLIINKTFIIQARYNYSPETEFINKKDVIVNSDGSVAYAPSKSKIETITISVGITLEKALQNMRSSAP